MNLSEKMYVRAGAKRTFRSVCGTKANQNPGGSLFDNDWEVFVIKRDETTGKFDWYTQCCEGTDRSRDR